MAEIDTARDRISDLKDWREAFEEYLTACVKDAKNRTMPDGVFRANVAEASVWILVQIRGEKKKEKKEQH